jgi:hypothetical protein
MTFPFSITQDDPAAPEEAAPISARLDPPGLEASRLAAAPQIGSRAATIRAPDPPANAATAADPQVPVVALGPKAGDADIRIDASASTAAGAADAGRRLGLAGRAAALGLAACLGAAAGSAVVTTFNPFGSAALIARAEPLDDLRALKESVSQLRGHVKTLSDNLATLRTNFNGATATVTSQLTKIADEVEKAERLQSEHRAAVTAPESPPAAASEAKPAKPAVVEGWVLRGVTDGVALVEGRHGVIEIEAGDSLPGVGRIHEIKRQDGHWVVVTPKGLIVSAR